MLCTLYHTQHHNWVSPYLLYHTVHCLAMYLVHCTKPWSQKPQVHIAFNVSGKKMIYEFWDQMLYIQFFTATWLLAFWHCVQFLTVPPSKVLLLWWFLHFLCSLLSLVSSLTASCAMQFSTLGSGHQNCGWKMRIIGNHCNSKVILKFYNILTQVQVNTQKEKFEVESILRSGWPVGWLPFLIP